MHPLLHSPSGLHPSHPDEVSHMEVIPHIPVPVIPSCIHTADQVSRSGIRLRAQPGAVTCSRVANPGHTGNGSSAIEPRGLVTIGRVAGHGEVEYGGMV